jgi:hypothetical protein
MLRLDWVSSNRDLEKETDSKAVCEVCQLVSWQKTDGTDGSIKKVN